MIRLAQGQVTAEINEFGAWVESLTSGGQAILFPKTGIINETGEAKTRGGMHVCLPNFGPGGNSGLAQHGFGRTSLWSVIQQNEFSVTIKLEATEPSYAGLVSILTYHLDDNSLTAHLELSNEGSAPLRVAPGFHPYFALKPTETAVTVNDRTYDLNSLAGTKYVVTEKAQLHTSTRNISIIQESLTNWAIWTDQLGSYVCIEPTFGGNRFLEDEKQDELLAPGETRAYSLQIKI